MKYSRARVWTRIHLLGNGSEMKTEPTACMGVCVCVYARSERLADDVIPYKER